jgi:predicted enzyme related to lactoylglutathione lyase
MLDKSAITTMLPVSDVERASAFYADKLGLTRTATAGDGSVIFETGAGAIGLRAAEPGAQSAHTALSFEVSDITGEIRDLEARGVAFEDYDLPNLKTVGHIAVMGNEKAAWFCDPEGNILCIHQVTADG